MSKKLCTTAFVTFILEHFEQSRYKHFCLMIFINTNKFELTIWLTLRIDMVNLTPQVYFR